MFWPKMRRASTMGGVFGRSSRAMARPPRLNDVGSEKAFSWNDSSHLYESGCLSSEWCALLLLHLKRFTANMYVKAPINQAGQPASSVTAGPLCQYQLLYKRHKHISALINAIKWSSAWCAWLHSADSPSKWKVFQQKLRFNVASESPVKVWTTLTGNLLYCPILFSFLIKWAHI